MSNIPYLTVTIFFKLGIGLLNKQKSKFNYFHSIK